MLFKACPTCHKNIPSLMDVCPYCHRDEKGRDLSAAPLAEVEPLDVQAKADLDLLASEDSYVRADAVERLSQRGSAMVPHLMALVQNHSHRGVPDAARLLGRLRDRRAVSTLAQAMKIGNEDVRMSAAWALCQLNDPQGLDELLHESERNNPLLQSYIGYRLSGLQDARVVPSLMKLARNGNHEVAFQAVWALGEVGDATVIPFLRRQLSRRDPVIKAAAEVSLKRLGGPVRPILPMIWWMGGVIAGLVALIGWAWHFYR